MANRAYLYSLSNRPTSYADRPETISGLSEWAYDVPFSYRLLMSGDPQICASLVSDGFEDEPADKKSKLYAISSDFEIGFSRISRLIEILRFLAGDTSLDLIAALDKTTRFLDAHRDRYLLLETVEVDCMLATGEEALKHCVESEIEFCRQVGEAVEALPEDLAAAADLLKKAAETEADPPLNAFHGLRLDDDFDNLYEEKTEYPLGLEWTDVLWYGIWNKAKFEADGR